MIYVRRRSFGEYTLYFIDSFFRHLAFFDSDEIFMILMKYLWIRITVALRVI